MPPRPYDPLIAYDFSTWFDRIRETLVRSWKPVLQVLFLGSWLPTFVLTLIGGLIAVLIIVVALQNVSYDPEQPESASTLLPVFGYSALAIAVTLGLISLVANYFATVAEVAAMKVIANDAAGQRLPLLDTYKASMKLAMPTYGWLLLSGLVTGLGFLLCLLPGIYVAIALSLVVPIMVFEKRSGFSKSFQLTHTNFWPIVGRIVLLYVAVGVVSYATRLFFDLLAAPFQPSPTSDRDPNVLLAIMLVIALVQLVVTQAVGIVGRLVVVTGQVVTYAEARGRLQPHLSTAQLAAEANAPD